ncbi:MAG: hypothetical protein U0354_07135 [Candidatus Sericytochromatia bacterium]
MDLKELINDIRKYINEFKKDKSLIINFKSNNFKKIFDDLNFRLQRNQSLLENIETIDFKREIEFAINDLKLKQEEIFKVLFEVYKNINILAIN